MILPAEKIYVFSMKLNQVLVIFKFRVSPSPKKQGLATGTQIERQILHEETLKKIKSLLASRGIKCSVIDRDKLRTANLSGDLIITVGGDGTILAAAHIANNIPILGVNSTPGNSVGFYCLANISNLEKILTDIENDRIKPKHLPLMEAKCEGKRILPLALNDILFAGTSPAEMVRYSLTVGGKCESQRSSGIWFAIGPGSTAAIFSAGGSKEPINSTRIQYLVREPSLYPRRGYNLIHGFVDPANPIMVIPEADGYAIYIDGPKSCHIIPHKVPFTIGISNQRLAIFLKDKT